jgi:molecular chaperone IbpA
MATLDFTPLIRSSIGFDQIPGLLSQALQREETSYPPYDIEKLGEDQYRIIMAVAGFGRDDVEIVQEQNRLTVRGMLAEPKSKTFLHRGIAARPFERYFDLADYVEVTDAVLDEGLLVISLQRELPEALKARRIRIDAGQEPSGRKAPGTIEGKADGSRIA